MKSCLVKGGSMSFSPKFISKVYRVLALLLAFALCGVPELLAQTSSPAQPAQSNPATNQSQPNMTADPSLGPIEPAQTSTSSSRSSSSSPESGTSSRTPASSMPEPSRPAPPQAQTQQPLPDAPSNAGQNARPASQPADTATQPVGQSPDTMTTAPVPETPSNLTSQEPVGTAAAGKTESVGGAASRPAGTAMAPGKQRQVRSWLIKLGAVAAAGVALGVVYGLSKGTSPKP
jgi:cytoskeletal protein RodZ